MTAAVMTNSASAPQVNVSGAPMTATSVMPESQSDLAGCQCTSPATALVSSASSMRGERKVPSAFCNAASTRSKSAGALAACASCIVCSPSS